MQVNGKQVDTIQWLKDTGGANAIKRFSTPQSTPTTQSSGKVSLGKDEAAVLKTQLQLNKASVVTGSSMDNISSYLNQLRALQPSTQTTIPVTNTINLNASAGNQGTANGKNNTIDFRSNSGNVKSNSVMVSGNGNSVIGYNGGQETNTMAVTGDSNRIFAGQNVSNNSVKVTGGKNNIALAENASQNSVTVKGNNVKVSIGSQGITNGSNQNWNISVAADNVEVQVVNGKASVNIAENMKDKYKVSIDNTNKTLSVTTV